MSAGRWLELRCGAELSAVRVLNGVLDAALGGLGVSGGLRHDVTLAVAELVANVCRHEYAGGAGEVALRLEAGPDGLRLEVLSQGPRFDLDATLARLAGEDPLANLQGSGLGLRLVAALFDRTESDWLPERGNRIVLTKRLGDQRQETDQPPAE